MSQRASVYVMGVAVLSVLASVQLPGAESTADSVHEACGAHQGRCVTVKTPNLPYGPAAGKFKVPRGPDGKPDFTGVYAGPGFTHQVGPNDTEAPVIRSYDAKKMSPLTPLGEKELFRPTSGDLHIDDPIGLCLPYGFTSQIMVPYAQQWIQSPKYLVIRHEFMNNFSRVIPLDGRPHVNPVIKMVMGDSRGRWEGNDLVVETTNFTDKDAIGSNGAGYPGDPGYHSDQLKVIERFTRTGEKSMDYRITVVDEKTWVKPWTILIQLERNDDYQMAEYACHEGNYAMFDILSGARADEKAKK